MTRAEEFACKYAGLNHPPTRRDELEEREKCDIYGACFEAYTQAEKDLALTWEDIKKLDGIMDSMRTYTAWDAVNYPNDEDFYKEVLRRYNEKRPFTKR